MINKKNNDFRQRKSWLNVMSLITGIEEAVLCEWCPESQLPSYLGTASYANQQDLGNSKNEINIYALNDDQGPLRKFSQTIFSRIYKLELRLY